MSAAARGWRRAVMVGTAVVAMDQVTKAAVMASLEPGEAVPIVTGLQLTYVRNTGVAFGALADSRLPVALLAGAAMLGLLLFFGFNAHRPRLWLPVGLLLGGAVGNLADRARLGAVIDFIDPVAWPAFNLADSFIVIGIAAMVLVAHREERDERAARQPVA
jgi:signal peptidase II